MKDILRSSDEWYELIDSDMEIADPDGWDRGNMQYSWFEEKISLEEYTRRMLGSTLVPKGWNK